jgi:hypothetical protein
MQRRQKYSLSDNAWAFSDVRLLRGIPGCRRLIDRLWVRTVQWDLFMKSMIGAC